MLLTADRQTFTERALRCFLAQTYFSRRLFILDNGVKPFELPAWGCSPLVNYVHLRRTNETMGHLRNLACQLIGDRADIIAHWDSDDWNHPERLAVQVNVLETNGAGATGFHNLLFLDSRQGRAWEYDHKRTDRVLGTSLMYRRSRWQAFPFDEHKPVGEDTDWHKRVPVLGTNGVTGTLEPLLIAEVHGGNTSGVYTVFDRHMPAEQPEWRRAPEWDDFCKKRLYP